jgi:hypothetical protein
VTGFLLQMLTVTLSISVAVYSTPIDYFSEAVQFLYHCDLIA